MLKRINRDEVLDALLAGENVYIMAPVELETPILGLLSFHDFCIDPDAGVEDQDEDQDEEQNDELPEVVLDPVFEDEQPDEDAEEIAEDPEEEDETEDKPAENEDEPAPAEDTKPSAVHQKIVNMYLAGRTIKYIAQELNKSPGTVHYHLRKEGLV